MEFEINDKMKFYCLKCKKKIEIEDYKESISKNNRKMFRGVCPVCGTKVCRIGGVAK